MGALDGRADAIAQLVGREADPFQAALLLASVGIPVFPCAPGAKHPLIRRGRGFLDATTNTTQIAHWWSSQSNANLAIPTGAISGIDVVDIDVHEGSDGYKAFRRARDAGLLSGWSMLVRTPSNGLHIYFPQEEGRDQRSWQAPNSAVDFRGDGGYVLVPPSSVRQSDGSTRSYQFRSRSPAPVAAVDAKRLRRFLAPERSRVRRLVNPRPGTRASSNRLAEWLAQRPEGSRNASLFWASCRLIEDGADVAETISTLEGAAERAGLEAGEIERTVRSAHRAVNGPGQPESGSERLVTAVDDYFKLSSRSVVSPVENGRSLS